MREPRGVCPTRWQVEELLSYPIFMPKLSIHRMCAQEHLFHTYEQKVFTELPNVTNKVYLLHKYCLQRLR
jgi:hypothetical protein